MLLIWILIVGYIAIVWQEIITGGPSIALEMIDQLLGKWYPLGWVVDEYGYWACALVAAFYLVLVEAIASVAFRDRMYDLRTVLSNSVPYGEFQMMTYDVGRGP